MGRHEGHPRDSDMTDGDLLAAVVAHYVETLARCDDAQGWLSARGIDGETAVRFGVGLSDRTLGLVLPEGNRRAGSLLRSRLQALGVLRSTGHELFRGCVVIPVHDADGVVVQLGSWPEPGAWRPMGLLRAHSRSSDRACQERSSQRPRHNAESSSSEESLRG